MTMTIMPALIISILTLLNCLICVIVGLALGWELSRIGYSLFGAFWSIYSTLWIIGTITTITQWEKIHCGAFKKIFYAFTFPLFMLTYLPISITALFKKVEWTPIAHNRVKTLDEITKS